MIQLERQPLLTAEEFTRLSRYKGFPDGSHDRLIEDQSLTLQIDYFDKNWQKEGLPFDWYNLDGKVGFSMRNQMASLENPDDSNEIIRWTRATEKNLLAFKLEYLSDHLIYPCKYQRNPLDPSRFEDPLEGKDIAEIVKRDERKGSVKKAVEEAKEFLIQNGDAIAVITSPRGQTGLFMDNGKEIVYPDSYFLILQKQGDTIVNFSLKTDFSLAQCREVIYRLTGQRLDSEAPIEDYVRAVAKIKPSERLQTAHEVVSVLEHVSPNYVFEKKRWEDVDSDIDNWEDLYNFDRRTQRLIKEFDRFSIQGIRTKLELRKAVAATILLMSRIYFERRRDEGYYLESSWREEPLVYPVSYGAVLKSVAEIPGCAGGGRAERTVVYSLSARLGLEGPELGAEKVKCDCIDKSDNHYHCTSCGKKYADETHNKERTKKCECGFKFNC